MAADFDRVSDGTHRNVTIETSYERNAIKVTQAFGYRNNRWNKPKLTDNRYFETGYTLESAT